MFRKRLRISALFISILLTASLFAGCKEDNVSSDVSSDTATLETSSAKPLDEIESVQTDGLESYDFGGITISIGSTSKDFLFPETTESTIDEHKAQIVDNIAKRFNVKLEHVDLNYGKYSEEVLPSLLAGDLVADIIMPVIWEAGVLITSGVCMDFKDEAVSQYINFDNPWWDSTMEYASTINGATYCATPHFTSSIDYTFVMYFNKTIAEDVGITDLYELEKNNGWTWDKFREYAKKALKDVNGDGEMTLEKDRWGFLAPSGDSMSAFLTSAKCRAIEVDANTGAATYALNTERNIDIITTLNQIYTQDGIYIDSPIATSIDTYFVNGQTLFTAYRLNYLKEDKMREMTDDFGILLMPLGPDQTEYMSCVDHNASCVVIPATNSDAEELKATVVVLEGLAFATWKQGVPDIIDLYGVQYTRDDESDWAIKNLFNCTTYELTQLLYSIGSPTWVEMIEGGVLHKSICLTPNADVSAAVNAVADMAQQFIDDLWAENYKK